jgi:hypothetical protein
VVADAASYESARPSGRKRKLDNASYVPDAKNESMRCTPQGRSPPGLPAILVGEQEETSTFTVWAEPCSRQRRHRRGRGTRAKDVLQGPPYLSRLSMIYATLFLLMGLLANPADAAFINFQNCLSQAYRTSTPPPLQFTPLFVNAVFNASNSGYLDVRVWGNVSGAYTRVALPPPDDPVWSDPNITDGKIENLPPPHTKLTTLLKKVDVLTYEPYRVSSSFCGEVSNGTCPLAPSFTANG